MFLFGLFVVTAAAAALAGLVIKIIADAQASPMQISWREYVIGIVIIATFVLPGTLAVGYKLAQHDRARFVEHLNGYETAADVTTVTCSRDGPCANTYQCDPYLYTWTTESCSTDAQGRQSCHTEFHSETRYHDCPYCTYERSYAVRTTVGDFEIDAHRLPDNPDTNRWRVDERVPANVIAAAGVGAPDFWLAAKARLDSGRPGPASIPHDYDNYVLASETTLLKQWSGEVATLDSARLLPRVKPEIFDFYRSNKVHFVGLTVPDASQWQRRLADLNASAGGTLHTDVRVVIVRDASGTLDPDRYFYALIAAWQDALRNDRDALPKNALVFVLGTTDGARVAWARAGTGMPVGNEAIAQATKARLRGLPLVADSVIGTSHPEVTPAGLRMLHGPGAIEDLVFGLANPATRFTRVSMSGGVGRTTSGIGTGYLYLKGEIRPTRTGLVITCIVGFFLSCLVWVAAMFIDDGTYAGRRPFGTPRHAGFDATGLPYGFRRPAPTPRSMRDTFRSGRFR